MSEFNHDSTAGAKMLRALADCPEEKRLDTLVIVTKIYIEQPLVLAQFTTKGKK